MLWTQRKVLFFSYECIILRLTSINSWSILELSDSVLNPSGRSGIHKNDQKFSTYNLKQLLLFKKFLASQVDACKRNFRGQTILSKFFKNSNQRKIKKQKKISENLPQPKIMLPGFKERLRHYLELHYEKQTEFQISEQVESCFNFLLHVSRTSANLRISFAAV